VAASLDGEVISQEQQDRKGSDTVALDHSPLNFHTVEGQTSVVLTSAVDSSPNNIALIFLFDG
jgi:hypothetical protein